MNGNSLLDLPWLLRAPPDFAARVKQASGADLLALSQYALNINQCEKLYKALNQHDALAGLPTRFTLGIVANTTTDLLPAVFTVAAARAGIALRIHRADFDQAMQVALGTATPFAGVALNEPAVRPNPVTLERYLATEGH